MNKKLAQLIFALGLSTAAVGTLSAQDAEVQQIQNMDALKTYLQIEDGDENSFAHTLYLDQLHRDVLGASYNPEAAFELSPAVLDGVNRLISQGKEDLIPKYGISSLDTNEEFYNLLIGSHIPAQTIPVIKEIQSRIGAEETGRLFTDENYLAFMREAHSIYEATLSRTNPLVQGTQDAERIADLERQLAEKDRTIESITDEYQIDLASAELARVSSGHFPGIELELYSAIAKDIQARQAEGTIDADTANGQIDLITSALYTHLIEGEITDAQQYLSEGKLQDALYAITNAGMTLEGVKDVQQELALQLDPTAYDAEGQATYQDRISDLHSQITLAIDEQEQMSPEDLLNSQAMEAFRIEQAIRDHKNIARNARADDWQEVLDQYEATQDAIYNSYVTVLLNDAKMLANQGDINSANSLLEKARSNYDVLENAQRPQLDLLDADLVAMGKELDTTADYITMAEDKTLNRLQGDEFAFLIRIPMGINSIVTSASDGSTYDLTSTETTLEVGLGVGVDWTHRVDNLIFGLEGYLEGVYGWRSRSWSEDVSGESGSEAIWSTFGTNYNFSINGQADAFIGGRLGANPEQTKYFADVYGILSFKDEADIGHIETDNVDYSNNMWAIGPGVGTDLHLVDTDSFGFDLNGRVQYYLLNYSDTAYKGHEVDARLGLGIQDQRPDGIGGLSVYGDYTLNISKDAEVFHTIAIGGSIDVQDWLSLYGEGKVLDTRGTELTNGSIEPKTSAEFGVEFRF